MFEIHDESSAPEESREKLAITRASFGMIPNLEAVMATAPPLLSSYSHAWEQFDNTTLSPIEQQVVYQTANFENECNYCVPWHSKLSQMAGMDKNDIQALRDGETLSNSKLETLRQFTRTLIHNRGKVTRADLQTFSDAGYSKENALEVVLGIAIKTMSNFTNSIAGTPLDKEVQDLAWEKPRIPMRSE